MEKRIKLPQDEMNEKTALVFPEQFYKPLIHMNYSVLHYIYTKFIITHLQREMRHCIKIQSLKITNINRKRY